MTALGDATLRRLRVRVEGTVQGVGFRPFVYRLARSHGLVGWVLNDARGVLIEAEGDGAALDALVAALAREAPPLARVDGVRCEPVELRGDAEFAIVGSPGEGVADALVTPDTATCADCLRELLDPADRRVRYPFVNCTNCGPRFTIVTGVPYDRPRTTMAGFAMCDRCRAEYEDPADRRFHAQPNACPECGPQAWLADAEGRRCGLDGARDAVAAAARALGDGAIVAVKGIGGFHLACRADDEDAVARLRARKRREEKPFALMAGDLAAARALVELGAEAEALIVSRERPIVIAPRAPGARVAAAVAPGRPDLGVMLPYSPLHHLLLADAGASLVMTSGNLSDEPIAHRDDDALERLADIADRFLLHDRPIQTRTDDSIVRPAPGVRPVVLRRSRGLVPEALSLPVPARVDLLACGAELKSTFCLVKGSRAWVSHHVGDLGDYATLRSYSDGVEHFQRLFAVAPRLVAHDLHPDYLSTAYALGRVGVETVAVQHHHAHLAACLAEHGERGRAVGVIFDGTGYGTDGTVWGGELLAGDLAGCERVGHLWPVRLPGGEAAIRQPWRMACAWLVACGSMDPPAGLDVDAARWRAVAGLAAAGGPAAPVTTSVGRLFDAVAALCGLRAEVTFEGQAAMALEAACDPFERGAYPLPVTSSLVLDARETVLALVADLSRGVSAGVVAARFHAALARAAAEAGLLAAARAGTDTVVLSGGSFQNRVLVSSTAAALRRRGLRVLVPEKLPPNDGGVSYGQAAVAAARDAGHSA